MRGALEPVEVADAASSQIVRASDALDVVLAIHPAPIIAARMR